MSAIELTATAPTSLFQFAITIANAADSLPQDFANTTSPTDFTVASSDIQASTVEVISVTNTGTGLRTIKVHPEMTAGKTYTVTAVSHSSDNTHDFTVNTNLITAVHPHFPTNPLETLTLAIGQEFQRLVGVPETLVVQDFDPDSATTLFCETSLGFPSKGSLWINQKKYNYTSTFSGGFKGVTRDVPVGVPNDSLGGSVATKVGASSLVRLDMLAHDPEDVIA